VVSAVGERSLGMKNPDPKAWPRCSECKTDYVLRRAIVFKIGRSGSRDKSQMMISNDWVWQRDCKHRKAHTEVVNKRSSK
jgi:hypothetical protein